MFAQILIEIPDGSANTLRAMAEYISDKPTTLTEYLQNRLFHFASTLGPKCEITVQKQGLGDFEEVSAQ